MRRKDVRIDNTHGQADARKDKMIRAVAIFISFVFLFGLAAKIIFF